MQPLPGVPSAVQDCSALVQVPLRFAVACHAAGAAAWVPLLGIPELTAGLEQCGVAAQSGGLQASASPEASGTAQSALDAALQPDSEAAATVLLSLSQQVASASDLFSWASSGLVVGVNGLQPSNIAASAAASSTLSGSTIEAVTSEASLWLAALARATSGLLLQEWAHIRRLDAAGARQLRADLQVRLRLSGRSQYVTLVRVWAGVR
jgi:hypothetical protein